MQLLAAKDASSLKSERDRSETGRNYLHTQLRFPFCATAAAPSSSPFPVPLPSSRAALAQCICFDSISIFRYWLCIDRTHKINQKYEQQIYILSKSGIECVIGNSIARLPGWQFGRMGEEMESGFWGKWPKKKTKPAMAVAKVLLKVTQ